MTPTIREAVLAALGPRLRERGLDVAVAGSFDLFGSGTLDSVGFVELLLAVESAIGRRLDLDEMDLDRLDDLDALIAELERVGR